MRGQEEEQQEGKKVLIKQPFIYPNASEHYLTQMLGTHRCAQSVRKRREECTPLHLPGMAAFQTCPDIKPCLAAYMQIKTSLCIIFSILGAL